MNSRIKHTILMFTVLFGAIITSTVNAQSLSVKPQLARMENDEWGVGLDAEFDYQKEYTITSETEFPRLIEFDLNVTGTVLSEPSLNPKHQQADLFLGYLISFKKAQDLQLGQEPEPSKDYGSLGIGLNANFEANQTFTEQNLEQGLELRYVNSSKQVIPAVETSYLIVLPFRSEFRDDLNVEHNAFQRFEARAFWVIRLNRFLLNPDFRYFRAVDLSTTLKDNGLNDGFHSSILLGYVFGERESGPLQFLDFIYLQYNNGQFPVYLDNRETFEAGITFTF